MNIKTWQERWDTLGIPKDMAIQAEIDELRAALKERDALKHRSEHLQEALTDEQRKPLPDDVITHLWVYANKSSIGTVEAFARAIEASHGVKEQL